jgi:hypothetical protein
VALDHQKKLELSASVGFIHKEPVTMHGYTVLKNEYGKNKQDSK